MTSGLEGGLAVLSAPILAIVLWLVYAVPAYVLYTLVFRVRYGFSPVADRFPPRSLYGWVDMLLLVTVVGYSAWLTLGPRPDTASAGSALAGVALWSAGMALRWWAITTLGSHFRIGQDEGDKRAAFVAAGPYRFVRHPIYLALLLVAAGMALLTDFDLGAMTLLSVSLVYFVVQKRLEDRRWYRQIDREHRP